MTLAFDDDHALLQRMASDFFSANAPTARARALRETPPGERADRLLWQEMVELGWAGFLIPEAYGGSEFGPVGLGLALLEGGRRLASSPLLSSGALAASILTESASDAQKERYLTALATGRETFALAVDAAAHHAASDPAVIAERVADGYRLNGTKRFVIDGCSADWLVVPAKVDGQDGPGLFLIPKEAEGLACLPLDMVDGRDFADIRLADVHVGDDRLLGDAGRGAQALDQALDVGYACVAAEMLGVAREVFERTLAYLKERRQFGQAIGSFQALQHRAAIMFCELEVTEAAVISALLALQAGGTDASRLCSAAKVRAGETLMLVSNEGIQLHGGIGMTDEHDVGLFLKRARVLEHMLGSTGYHVDRFARLSGY